MAGSSAAVVKGYRAASISCIFASVHVRVMASSDHPEVTQDMMDGGVRVVIALLHFYFVIFRHHLPVSVAGRASGLSVRLKLPCN